MADEPPASASRDDSWPFPNGGDHDEPYHYYRPTTKAPFPFTERQYARLLIARARVHAEGDHARS